MSSPTLHIGAALNVVRALANTGVDTGALMKEVGFSEDDERVDVDKFQAFLTRGAVLSNDPILGLRIGTAADPFRWQLLALIAAASNHLEEAVARTVKYGSIWSQATVYEVDGPDVVIRVHGAVPNVWMHIQLVVASFVGVGRAIAATPWSPQKVDFSFPTPDEVAPFEEMLGCPVRFDRPRTMIRLPEKADQIALKAADPAFVAALEKQGDALLERLPPASSLIRTVREKVLVSLVKGPPRLSSVAQDLGMTSRTLQRKLEHDGAQFATIADDARRELALHLLEEDNVDAVSTALRCGFTDPSALHRAVKRWTGGPLSAVRDNPPDSKPPPRKRSKR